MQCCPAFAHFLYKGVYRRAGGRASKRNFARRKTALGCRGQTETSLKIEDLRSNKTTGKRSYDQQPEFRSLSEFYIISFLNKLNIVKLKYQKQI